MTNITLTKIEVIDLLSDLVADYGEDYVYDQERLGGVGQLCVYTDGEKPSCIVGHVLFRAGTPLNVLKAIDFGGVVDEDGELHTGSLADTNIWEDEVQSWLNANGIVLSEAAMDILGRVQRMQDDGVPWGKAVKRVKEGY